MSRWESQVGRAMLPLLLAVAVLACPLRAEDAKPPVDLSTLYAEATAARARRDAKTAIEKLNRLVERKPDSFESWWLLAWLYDAQGRQKDALKAFRQAAQTLPEGDSRRAEARRRVDKLARALENRVTPAPYQPPHSHWTWYLPSGRSLALLLVLLAVCALGWRRAWREDRARGPRSAAAQRARLAERLRCSDPTALAELLERAQAGTLDTDEQLLLAAAAARDSAAQARLRDLLTDDATAAALPAVAKLSLPAEPAELRALALGDDERAAAATAALAQAMLAQATLAQLDGAARDLLHIATHAAQRPVRDAAMAALLATDSLPADLATPLAKRLGDPSAEDRPRLALALARCGPGGAAALVRATVDDDDAVRAAAGDELRLRPELKPLPDAAMKLIAQAAGGKRPKLSPEFLAVAAEADAQLALPLLRHAVDSRHWPLRGAAVELSPLLSDDEAVALLQRAFGRLPRHVPAEGPEQDHWRRLCGTLAERPLAALLPDLLARAADQPDESLALPTAQLLARAPGGREALARAADDASPEVRRLASELLAAS